MTEQTFLGLSSDEWWEIYDAENPLAKALRKMKKIVRSALGGANFGDRVRASQRSLRENT